MRKIVALSEIYGIEAVARALQDGLAFQAFSCEYIANMLEARAQQPEAGALHLIRHQDWLALELAQPDLSCYRVPEANDDQDNNASRWAIPPACAATRCSLPRPWTSSMPSMPPVPMARSSVNCAATSSRA